MKIIGFIAVKRRNDSRENEFNNTLNVFNINTEKTNKLKQFIQKQMIEFSDENENRE